ncbi:hypothetical protein FJZ48_02950 [Candidatus Uhrbacteria bacterium]|nr:hypothetical protein [Candidatus Uhrbacteria bacterium]
MKILKNRAIRLAFLTLLGICFGWLAADFRYSAQKGDQGNMRAVADLFVPPVVYDALWNLDLHLRERFPVLHPENYCCMIRDDQGNMIAWTREAKEVQRVQVATLITLYYGLLFVLVGEMMYVLELKKTAR